MYGISLVILEINKMNLGLPVVIHGPFKDNPRLTYFLTISPLNSLLQFLHSCLIFITILLLYRINLSCTNLK